MVGVGLGCVGDGKLTLPAISDVVGRPAIGRKQLVGPGSLNQGFPVGDLVVQFAYVEMLPTGSTQYDKPSTKFVQLALISGFRK